MPLIVVSLIAACMAVGIATDFMRDFRTVRELQFGAETTALYGMSMASNPDGSYSQISAQANISNAIIAASANNWNQAQCGPINLKTWSLPVNFDQTDINFVNNPNPLDPNDLWLELRARRDGDLTLQQFFLKAVYAATTLTGQPMPPNAGKSRVFRYAEVVGQPASRIGAAAPWSSPVGSAGSLLAGSAAFPLAISNAQFQPFASQSTAGQTIVVDLVTSTSAEYTGAAPPGHVKGAF